jgi:hypothetical protein
MLQVGFEWAKTVHALDRAATVIGLDSIRERETEREIRQMKDRQ